MRLVPLLLLASMLCSCGQDQAPQADPAPTLPPPPPGAVVRLGPDEFLGDPFYILADEVDRWVPAVSILEAEESQRSWRRKALTNINLPRAVIAALFPEDRAVALEHAQRLRADLLSGAGLPLDGPQVTPMQGHVFELDRLIVWSAAVTGELREWSELFETRGGFAMVRRTSETPTGGWRMHTPVALELLEVRYVPRIEVEMLIEDARPKITVTPVGPPEWRGILPALYVYE